MSLISTEKLVRSLTMLRRSAGALQGIAQGYLDGLTGDGQCHWKFDENGSGRKKTAAERRVLVAFNKTRGKLINIMPEIDALAADIARTAGELDALRKRIEELAKVYELPPPPEAKENGLEDLG